MQFLTDKLLKLHFGWNERPLTESDFFVLCKRFNITVEETPLTTSGFYFRVMGRNVIALDSRLAGTERLAVLFHELGHFLFHAPESGPAVNFHSVGTRTRKECEADVFALCALLPHPWIKNRPIRELIEDEGFTPEMLTARLAILDRHGI